MDARAGVARAFLPGSLLAVLALALALATALRLPAAWESGNALNHVSGTWMTLADDLARGTLYRPLHAPGEWGGTRYFPLAFALQAGARWLGAPPLEAGQLASLLAGILLVVGVFLLLRRSSAAWRAAALAPLALSGFAVQHALTAARGDLLPVALCALALAALLRRPAPGAVALAALLLSLAFAAKPTALTAAAAAVAFLALGGERRAAAVLLALVGAGASITVATTDALSGGRFLAGLGALASAGGGADTALRAPIRLAEELAVADPAGLVVAVAAAVVLVASLRELAGSGRARGDPRALLALWVLSAWAGALAVFATPGTGVNHLVEIEVASAAFLGSAALSPGRPGALARAGAPLAAAAALVLALAMWRADLASSRLAELRAVVRALPPGAILSEDPLVPLLAGARPALLDSFSLRVAGARDPAILQPLADALREGQFAAVVLFEDPGTPAADAWYAAGNLGLPIVREIGAGYRRAAAVGRYRVYVPRAPSDVVVSDGAP